MMETIDLNVLKKFSSEKPIKQLVHDSEHLQMALICLEKGQEIPSHSAPSTVMMQVLEGEGEFTVGAEKREGTAGQVIPCAPDAPHGIRAVSRLAVLAIVAPRPA
jgi:quercetin dioxygenase-like cupin family protein